MGHDWNFTECHIEPEIQPHPGHIYHTGNPSVRIPHRELIIGRKSGVFLRVYLVVICATREQFFGFELPTTTAGNYSALAVWESSNMDASNFQPGDVLWVHSSAHQHVGIYIGNGDYIHSSSGSAYSVIISNLNENYSARTYVCARRVLR